MRAILVSLQLLTTLSVSILTVPAFAGAGVTTQGVPPGIDNRAEALAQQVLAHLDAKVARCDDVRSSRLVVLRCGRVKHLRNRLPDVMRTIEEQLAAFDATPSADGWAERDGLFSRAYTIEAEIDQTAEVQIEVHVAQKSRRVIVAYPRRLDTCLDNAPDTSKLSVVGPRRIAASPPKYPTLARAAGRSGRRAPRIASAT